MKTKEIYQYALAAVIVLAFMFILLIMIIYSVQDNPVMNTMVGTFGTITVMVVSYFFGSSKGSSDKNEMIEKIKNGSFNPK